MPRGRPYVRVDIPLHSCCLRLCAREKKTRSKFDLLSEVIFKDLAVPAVTIANFRKLVCPSCGHVLLILGSGGKLCSGPQTPPTLPIDTMLPATWLGSRTSLYAWIHHSRLFIIHAYSLLLSFVHCLNFLCLWVVPVSVHSYVLHES